MDRRRFLSAAVSTSLCALPVAGKTTEAPTHFQPGQIWRHTKRNVYVLITTMLFPFVEVNRNREVVDAKHAYIYSIEWLDGHVWDTVKTSAAIITPYRCYGGDVVLSRRTSTSMDVLVKEGTLVYVAKMNDFLPKLPKTLLAEPF